MKLLQTKHVTISVDRTRLREKIEGLIFWGLLVALVMWWKKGSKSQS